MIWPERKTDQHEASGGTRFFADVPAGTLTPAPSGIVCLPSLLELDLVPA